MSPCPAFMKAIYAAVVAIFPPLDPGQAYMQADDVSETYMVTKDVSTNIEDYAFTQSKVLSPGDLIRPSFTSGDRFFSFRDDGNTFYGFSCSTDWDISTATVGNTAVVSALGAIDNIVKPSGDIVLALLGTSIQQCTMSTPYDASTITKDTGVTGSLGSIGTPVGFCISPDGTKIFVGEVTGQDTIHQYTLSTPWDITTISKDTPTYDVPQVKGLAISDDGQRLYVVGSLSDIYQYDLPTPFDLTGASASGNIFTATNAIERIHLEDSIGFICGQYSSDTLAQYNATLPDVYMVAT